VRQWAEVRRLHFVRGLSIREIHRRTGLHRETIRNALKSDGAARYSRAPAGSKLDPFKDEIHRLLREDPRLPGQRVRELIAPLGSATRPTRRGRGAARNPASMLLSAIRGDSYLVRWRASALPRRRRLHARRGQAISAATVGCVVERERHR